jgi:geranylgeranyl reductase family protein
MNRIKSAYEAVVVGAGPAGCSAAIHLKKLGVDVLLLDKAVFPRDKICGDGIPLKCFPLLEELGIKKQLLLDQGYPIRQLNIHTPNGEVISYRNFEDDSSPKSVCMARKDFDFLLINRAKECLSQVALGTEVIQLDENSQKIHILLVKERGTGCQKEISARVIIGADGSHSIISRQSKMISPRSSDRLLGLRAYHDNDYFEPMVNIIYDKLTLPGYVWIFPISRKRSNIGMVLRLDNRRRTRQNPVNIFKDIINRHAIFKGLQNKEELFNRIEAFPLRLGSAKGLRVKDGIILAGDAALFINPLTGGEFSMQSSAENMPL